MKVNIMMEKGKEKNIMNQMDQYLKANLLIEKEMGKGKNIIFMVN